MLAKAVTTDNIIPFSKMYAKKTRRDGWKSVRWLPSPLRLQRKGSQISIPGKSWQLLDFSEVEFQVANKEFFQAQTDLGESLIISRPKGEKGMREIFLVAVCD